MITLSTITVSIIIYHQNRDSSNQILNNAEGIAKEEISRLNTDILSYAKQLTKTGNVGETMTFLKSLDKSQDDSSVFTYRGSYRDLALSLYSICQAGEIEKTSLYDMNGRLAIFIFINKKRTIIGYSIGRNFDIIELSAGESSRTEKWKENVEFKGVNVRFEGQIPKQEQSGFALVDNLLSEVILLPVNALFYNRNTDKMEDKQSAFISVTNHFHEDFASRLSRLSGIPVNLFAKNKSFFQYGKPIFHLISAGLDY